MLLAGALPAGLLDPSFGLAGVVGTTVGTGRLGQDNWIIDMGPSALQPDGSIVIAGAVTETAGIRTIAVLRYLQNGRLDPSFGPDQSGIVVLDPTLNIDDAKAVAIVDDPGHDDDGQIVVAGTRNDPAAANPDVFALVRFNPDGSIDTNFGAGGMVVDTHPLYDFPGTPGNLALAVQQDGKILVGTANVGTGAARIATAFVERFDVDGTLDPGFADPGLATALFGGYSSTFGGLALDGSGDIVVAAARITTSPASDSIVVARLRPDGTLDPSFGSSGIATINGFFADATLQMIEGIAIDPSRGILVAGTAVQSSSFEQEVLVTRLTLQGNLDPSFNEGAVEFPDLQQSAQFDIASAMAVEPDDKVLLAGDTSNLARLNLDGTLDAGFGVDGQVTAQPLEIRSILFQGDGNIVVSGNSGEGASFALARYLVETAAPAPLVGPIAVPPPPVPTGTVVSFSASFMQPGSTGPHTAVWNWGDDTTSVGTVSEANGSGSVTGTHAYAVAGIYPVTLTVTDSGGAAGQSIAIPGVIVWQPITGMIAGNVRLLSPLGALPGDPSLTGNASFQLDADFSANGAPPKGKVVLKLKAAHLAFRSTGIDWLVVDGGSLFLQGKGTVNGAEAVRFRVSAAVGRPGSGKLRIQIWDGATGTVVYDTQPGASLDAAPTTLIRGGTIAVHVKHPRHIPKRGAKS